MGEHRRPPCGDRHAGCALPAALSPLSRRTPKQGRGGAQSGLDFQSKGTDPADTVAGQALAFSRIEAVVTPHRKAVPARCVGLTAQLR